MLTITANIPARKATWGGKPHIYPARVEDFTQSEDGKWSGSLGAISEADVIDVCRKATNWAQIRTAHFAMYGFTA